MTPPNAGGLWKPLKGILVLSSGIIDRKNHGDVTKMPPVAHAFGSTSKEMLMRRPAGPSGRVR